MSLKDSWKETGENLGNAFMGLGKSIIKSVKTGIEKADEWANSDENAKKPEEQKPEENK